MYIIKIGTQSLLNPQTGGADHAVLHSLVTQIAALKAQHVPVVLVSSGAVGSGRAALKHVGKLSDPITTKQIYASVGQALLIQTYAQILAPFNITPAQILLTRHDFSSRNQGQQIVHLLRETAKNPHLLPIINENDSVAIDELMFTDNDALAGLLAGQLHAQKLIMLTNVAGVYDKNPELADAKIIPLIDPLGKRGAPMPKVSAEKSALGRGGMASKLQSAKRLSQQGVTTHILQLTDNALLALHQNQHIGTTVLGAVTKPTTTKRWLVSGTQGDVGVQTKGVVVANPCLAERLQNADAVVSILPIGLLAVHGVFDKNDLVFVQNEAGQNLAIGRVRYNAATLKSYLGQAKQPIFMHHDYLARIDNYHV